MLALCSDNDVSIPSTLPFCKKPDHCNLFLHVLMSDRLVRGILLPARIYENDVVGK